MTLPNLCKINANRLPLLYIYTVMFTLKTFFFNFWVTNCRSMSMLPQGKVWKNWNLFFNSNFKQCIKLTITNGSLGRNSKQTYKDIFNIIAHVLHAEYVTVCHKNILNLRPKLDRFCTLASLQPLPDRFLCGDSDYFLYSVWTKTCPCL